MNAQADRDARRVHRGMWKVIILLALGITGALGILAYFLAHGHWEWAALLAISIVGGRFWYKSYNGVGPR